MDLFSGLSDDQTALVGCFVALAACGGLLALSSLIGRQQKQRAEPATLRFPAAAAHPRTAEVDEIERRAA